MKAMHSCPLCSSESNIIVNEILYRRDLIELNKTIFSIDIDHIVPSDIDRCTCAKCKLSFFWPQYSGDDSYYDQLNRAEWYYEHEGKYEYQYAKRFLHDGIKVLDIGSGKGVFGKIAKNTDYLGLELSGNAVKEAELNGVNVVQMTIEEFSLKNNKNNIDLVCAFQVLEHISNIESFFISINGVIKAGGTLLIAVPNNNSLLKWADNNILNLPPHHILLWCQESLLYLSDKYGYSVIDICRERVSSVHAEWFRLIKISAIVKKIFLIKHRSIDASKKNVILNKISFRIMRIIKYIGIDVLRQEDGHTIIFALKKN